MFDLPHTVDGESIALYADGVGGIGISILGHRAINLDPDNTALLANYVVSMALYSAHTAKDIL